MKWKKILKQEKHIDYLHSKLKPIMGDLTDETVREFQSKFSDKYLKDWYIVINTELHEPDTPKDIEMFDNWRAVEDWFKKYGSD